MPTREDYMQKWLDGMFGAIGATYKPVKIVFEGENKVGPVPKKTINFNIQSITANHKKNAFTVVWGDGSHTIIHLQKGDVWDDEKALAMCFVKHMMGDKGSFNDIFTEDMPAKIKHIGKVEPVEEKHECKCSGRREEDIHSCKGCLCHTKIEETAEAEKFIEEIEALKKRKNAFGISEQTATELGKAANKANVALTEMINALTNEADKGEGKPEPAHIYKVYLKISGESLFDSNHYSIESLRERVHAIAEEHYGRKPYYYRTWMGDNGRMIIDFGHYTQFIEIEGITPDEYAKN